MLMRDQVIDFSPKEQIITSVHSLVENIYIDRQKKWKKKNGSTIDSSEETILWKKIWH